MQRSLAVLPRAFASVARSKLFVSPLRSLSVFRDPATVVHRSNAEEMIDQTDVIMVDRDFAVCDGGGGAMGHPAEYITLAGREGEGYTGVCKYCGLRFQQKGHHHDIAWDKSITADLPAGRGTEMSSGSAAGGSGSGSGSGSGVAAAVSAAASATPTPVAAAPATDASAAPATTGAGSGGAAAAAATTDSASSDTVESSSAAADTDSESDSSSSSSSESESDSSTRGISDGNPMSLELDLIEDTVTVTNTTDKVLKLKGWTLLSDTGTQVFKFPARTALKPGESCKVWSGRETSKETHHKPPHNLFWTRRYIWNNKGDTAIIKDPKGNVQNRIALP